MADRDHEIVTLISDEAEVFLSTGIPAVRGSVLQRVFATESTQTITGLDVEKRHDLGITADRFTRIRESNVLTGNVSRELVQWLTDMQCEMAVLVRPTSLNLPQVFRELKCPTLLLREIEPNVKRVVAAVHLEPEDTERQKRHARVLDHAYWLADRFGAQLDILQAWSYSGAEVLKSHMTPEQLTAEKELRKTEIRSEIDRLLAKSPVNATPSIQLIEGEPLDVISSISQESTDQVFVMGTVARTGIHGLLLGNAVEKAIESPASFLVVPAIDN